MDYRPTPDQRSTLELLQYISFHVTAFTASVIENDWEPYKRLAEESYSMVAEDFLKAMETQMKAIEKLLDPVTDEDMFEKEAQVPWGETLKMGRALLELPYRCIAGYRMQLFLYARQAGNDKLNTANCWAGADAKMS